MWRVPFSKKTLTTKIGFDATIPSDVDKKKYEVVKYKKVDIDDYRLRSITSFLVSLIEFNVIPDIETSMVVQQEVEMVEAQQLLALRDNWQLMLCRQVHPNDYLLSF